MEFPDLDQVSLELVIPTPVLTREGKLFLEVVDVVMCVDQLGLERIAQPDGALDYLCRKPMSAVADLVHNRKLLATRS